MGTRGAKASDIVGRGVSDWQQEILAEADFQAERIFIGSEEKEIPAGTTVDGDGGSTRPPSTGKITKSGDNGDSGHKSGPSGSGPSPNNPGGGPSGGQPGGGGPNGPGVSASPRPMNEIAVIADKTFNVLDEEKDQYAGLKARAKAHFLTAGYSDKALQSATSKMLLWLSRSGVNDTNLSVKHVDMASNIIWNAFASRASIGSWWQRLRLQVYDWCMSRCTPKNFLLTVSAVSVATSVALSYLSVIRPKTFVGITVASLTVGTIGVYKNRPKLTISKCEKLSDYCTRTSTVDVPIAAGADVTLSANSKCAKSVFHVGLTTAPSAIWIPRLCSHNELNALINRQLLPALGTPTVRRNLWQQGKSQLLNDLPPMASQDIKTPEEVFEFFLSKYPLNRRDNIRRAYIKKGQSFLAPECISKCFVKREWLVGKKLEKRNPRLISSKSDDYLSETGPDYYLFQKEMCKHYWNEISCFNQKYIYTGGMTGDQIGALFAHHVLSKGWEVIEGDYSRYDGHNEEEAIEAEMDYYSPVLNADVLTHMRLQLRTNGSTSCGHRFKCVGKVASGVINTSFGNTLRGFMILASYERAYGYKDWAVMQLGDDNVIFAKDIEAFNLPRLVEFAAAMGHKLEAIHRPDPDFAEYCSQRFWRIGDTYVLGPKPGRVLAKTFVCHDASLSAEDMPEYCRGVAVGFQHYTWVPVLSKIVEKMLSMPARKQSANVREALNRMQNEQFHKINLRTELDVDLSSVYTQFAKIYDFDARDLERDLEGWDCEFGVSIHHELLDKLNVVDGVCDDSINYIDLFNPTT
jgi:hypothetical protein